MAVEIGVMELLTKGQLSEHIGVTPRTVESWMRDGLLPYIIFRNYLELVTQTQARSWFGIKPEAKENVTLINSVG